MARTEQLDPEQPSRICDVHRKMICLDNMFKGIDFDKVSHVDVIDCGYCLDRYIRHEPTQTKE